MAKIKAAGVFIIQKSGKVLICHPTNHSSKVWSIPKGRVEENETLMNAAIRETFEETNIDLTQLKDFELRYMGDAEYRTGKKVLSGFMFLERQESNFDWDSIELRCDSTVPEEEGGFPEMDDFKWVEISEAKELIHETQVKILTLIEDIL